MTTLKQIWLNRRKAKVNGHVWDVIRISVNGRDAILIRMIEVKAHLRGVGNYQADSFRTISIRRPIELLAEMV